MEPSANAKYRVLGFDEATKTLQLERQYNSLTSWLEPHFEKIVKYCDTYKGQSFRLYLEGREFEITKTRECKGDWVSACCTGEYVLMPTKGFTPMAQFCLHNMKRVLQHGAVT